MSQRKKKKKKKKEEEEEEEILLFYPFGMKSLHTKIKISHLKVENIFNEHGIQNKFWEEKKPYTNFTAISYTLTSTASHQNLGPSKVSSLKRKKKKDSIPNKNSTHFSVKS